MNKEQTIIRNNEIVKVLDKILLRLNFTKDIETGLYSRYLDQKFSLKVLFVLEHSYPTINDFMELQAENCLEKKTLSVKKIITFDELFVIGDFEDFINYFFKELIYEITASYYLNLFKNND